MLHKEYISYQPCTHLSSPSFLSLRSVWFRRPGGTTFFSLFAIAREIPPWRATNFRTLTDFRISVTLYSVASVPDYEDLRILICEISVRSLSRIEKRGGKPRSVNIVCTWGDRTSAHLPRSAPEGTGPFINPDATQDGLCQGARRLPRVRPSVARLLFLSLFRRRVTSHVLTEDAAGDPPRWRSNDDEPTTTTSSIGRHEEKSWCATSNNLLLFALCPLAIGWCNKNQGGQPIGLPDNLKSYFSIYTYILFYIFSLYKIRALFISLWMQKKYEEMH